MVRPIIQIVVPFLCLVASVNSEFIREQSENDIDAMAYHSFNISTDIKPMRYDIDIRLDPDLNFKYYNGTTKIHFQSLVNSNRLIFHFNKTENSDVHLIRLTASNHSNQPKDFNSSFYSGYMNEFYVLESNNVDFLMKDEYYDLYVEFKVRFVEDSVVGFYKTCTTLGDGTKNCYTATQMEIHNIRNSLPSFDYVGFKSHFNLRIKHHKDLLALSNMPGAIAESDGDMVTTKFEQTPPMATYLLAFAVGKFDCIPIENESNIALRLCTPIETDKGSSTVQKYSGPLLKAIEVYMNKTYALPKLDFLATPTHSTLGMENWGLIIYNYDAILEKRNPPTTKNIEKSLSVVAHELAHQFFGNLVTMKERKHLWLNEGFATYFTHRMLATVFPDEDYIGQIILPDIDGAFFLERQLESTILDDFHVNMSLTQTTLYYHKGSAIIQMINHVMGENSFRRTIQNYLNTNAYGSVTPDNLITEIQLVNSVDHTIPDYVDIKGFIDSWIYQDRIPIVTVTRNYETGEVELSQSPYNLNSETSNHTWWIPYNYATKSKPSCNNTFPDGWLKKETSIKLPLNLAADDWFLLNRYSTGFYIVHYDEKNWKLIAEQLASDDYEQIPAIDRAKLLIDAFLLSYYNNTLSMEIITDLLRLLKNDRHYLPWLIADKYIRKQYGYYSEELFKENNGIELIENLFNHFGLEIGPNETRQTQLTRNIAINWLCDIDLPLCNTKFNRLSKAYLRAIENNESYSIPPDQKKFLFCYGFQDVKDFDKIFEYMQATNNQLLKKEIYANFDCHSNFALFRKYYVPIVFDLKLPEILVKDKAMLVDAFKYREYVNDIDVFSLCLKEKCYDFNENYPEEAERKEIGIKIMENIVNIMRRKFDLKPSTTIHELLETVKEEFGEDVSAKIRDKFDLNKRYLNYG